MFCFSVSFFFLVAVISVIVLGVVLDVWHAPLISHCMFPIFQSILLFDCKIQAEKSVPFSYLINSSTSADDLVDLVCARRWTCMTMDGGLVAERM